MNAVEQMIENAKALAKMDKQVETAIIAKGKSDPRIPLKRYAGGLIGIVVARNETTHRELYAKYCLESIVENCLDIYYNEYLPLANESN